MIDPKEILVENYRECLRQVSRYMTLAIGISSAIFLLLVFPQEASEELPLWVSLSAPRWFVLSLLVGAYIAMPFVARFPVRRARAIVGMLSEGDDKDAVVAAVRTYPGLLVSHKAIFTIVPFICSILMVAAVLIATHEGFNWEDIWGMFFVLSVAFLPYAALSEGMTPRSRSRVSPLTPCL